MSVDDGGETDLTYAFGIDVGTTFTAAAVTRHGRAEIFQLGSRSAVVPTIVALGDTDQWLVGDTAERRARTDPDRAAMEFKRRFGDPAPLLLGSSPVSADHLTARVIQWVIDQVQTVEGEPPARIAVAHPASWGPYKLDLLRSACLQAGIAEPMLVPEPVAAAVHYSELRDVPDGAAIAVYDLGGGTFDATVLRSVGGGYEVVGEPQGLERVGGTDIDAAVVEHIRRTLSPGTVAASEHPDERAAQFRLRDEAREAKEALSEDSDTVIVVPSERGEERVRLTRAELEDMARLPVRETVETLRRAIEAAGLRPDDIDRILLVGGSSRIPLVAETVRTELDRPVVVDANPKHAVALGAAAVAAGHEQPDPPTPAATAGETVPAAASGRRSRGWFALGAAVVAALVLIGAVAWAVGGDDTDDPPPPVPPSGGILACCPFEGAGLPAGALPVPTGLAAGPGVTGLSVLDGGVWTVALADRSTSPLADVGGNLVDAAYATGPDGRVELWVVDVEGSRVVALSGDARDQLAEVPVGDGPVAVAVAPPGEIWVANAAAGSVSVIDPVAQEVIDTVPVAAGPAVIRHLAGSTFVVSAEANVVTQLDTTTREVLREIPVGAGPVDAREIAGAVWVPNSLDGTVSVIDPASGDPAVRATVDTQGALSVAPVEIAGHVWVATGAEQGVALLDPASGALIGHVTAGAQPVSVVPATGDGGEPFVVVSDFAGGTVLVADPAAVIDAVAQDASGAEPAVVVDFDGWEVAAVEVGARTLQPLDGAVLVELFPGGSAAFVDLPSLEVTVVTPGNDGGTEPPNGVTVTTPRSQTGSTTTPPSVSVPNVVGIPRAQAVSIISESGLRAQVSTAPSEEVPAGVVSSQSPSSGSLREGSTVSVVVSSGPDDEPPPTVPASTAGTG